MKKFITRFVIFLLIVFILDFGIGKVLSTLYQNTNDYTISKLRYTLEQSDEDIIILGSSRAQHHYNSKIIEQKTGLSTYNCGFGGQGLTFSSIQLYERIKRKPPKIVIIDVSSNILLDKESQLKLGILKPYYNQNTQIREELNQGKVIEKIKFISSIYPYNSDVVNLAKGLFITKNDSLKGFLPLYGEIDTANLKVKTEKGFKGSKIEKKDTKVLSEIIDLCYENDIRLIIIISPVYYQTDEMKQLNISILQNIDLHPNTFFFDFSESFKNQATASKYFTDNLHLNENGANYFTTNLLLGDIILFKRD